MVGTASSERNATNPARSSGRNGAAARCSSSAAQPTPRNFVIASTDASSGLQRRVSNAFVGRNANIPS
jgi:hypothetical protein